MALAFGKQIDVSSLTNVIRNKAQNAIERNAKIIRNALRAQVSQGNTGYRDGGGISPYDYINSNKSFSDRAINKWSSIVSMAGSSIVSEFTNMSSYAEFLYSKKSSVGHTNGFRSAYPHEEHPYKYIGGEKIYFDKRPNQLTFAKWMGFRRYVKKKLETDIRKEFGI